MGVPNAAMWGIRVAIFEFCSLLGPVAGVPPAGRRRLLAFRHVVAGTSCRPAWYLLLHLLETNLITPVLLGRRFTLNPVVIFVP